MTTTTVTDQNTSFLHRPCSMVGAVEWDVLATAARNQLPDIPQRYITKRKDRYDAVAVLRRGGVVQSWMLTCEWQTGHDTYAYIGPLFSHRGCFMTLLAAWLDNVWNEGQRMYVMAEFQNPRLFAYCMELAAECAYAGASTAPRPH